MKTFIYALRTAVLAGFLAFTACLAHAAPGDLDPLDVPIVGVYVSATAIQPDGKIILAGRFTSVLSQSRNNIARLNADGTLDAGFNPDASGTVHSVSVQADGRILLGGAFTRVGGTPRNYIARLNADGTLDAGFNPDVSGRVYSVAVQADGRILLGGEFTTVGGTGRNRIARVDAAGALDAGFNPNANSTVYSVALQADGGILLGGDFASVGGTGRNRIARLLNDPTTHSLSMPSATQLIWTRGGSSPEVSQVTFDHSTDTGATWTPFGVGTRISSTANWQLTGLTLPASGLLRARARTSGGSSSGLVELVASLPLAPAPTVASISPTSGSTLGGTRVTITGTDLTTAMSVSFGGTAATTFSATDATTLNATTPAHAPGAVDVVVAAFSGIGTGNSIFTYVTPPPTVSLSTVGLRSTATTVTITGTSFSTTPGNNSVAFTPTGTGTVTAATATSLTVSTLSGLSLGALNAIVTTDGLTSGAAVQVATVVTTGDLDPLDLSFPDYNGVNTSVAQPDGKTLIGGLFSTVLGQPRNCIARLNADGTLDAGFNPNVIGSIFCVAVQADGGILLGGDFTSVGGTARNNIARVNAAGALDTNFNPNANGQVYNVAMQADGGILLGGGFTTMGETERNRIARVNSAGTLDTSFNPNLNSNVITLVVQADDRILLGGSFTTVGGTPRNHIARLDADGTLDAGFNPNASDSIESVAVQADGRLLLGGWFTGLTGTARNYIARLNTDGTLDAGFNPDTDSTVFSVMVQGDGGILLGGDFDKVNGTARSAFARLFNDSAPQTLSTPNASQLIWTRGGSSSEVSQVTFEKSTDSGTSWTPLGSGTRIGTTSNWQLTGLALPASGQLRARGRTTGGYKNGSSGLIEQVASFSGLLPALETWRQTHFGTTANTGDAADTFDFDQDGLVNLIEFAFGLDPKLPSSSTQLPQPSLSDGNFALSFTPPDGVSGITYGAEWSTTLQPGSWTAIPDTGIYPHHVFSLPITGQPKMYTRLVVTAP